LSQPGNGLGRLAALEQACVVRLDVGHPQCFYLWRHSSKLYYEEPTLEFGIPEQKAKEKASARLQEQTPQQQRCQVYNYIPTESLVSQPKNSNTLSDSAAEGARPPADHSLPPPPPAGKGQ
jgi:hypothetical protein